MGRRSRARIHPHHQRTGHHRHRRRRAERAQDVPAALSVITGEMLATTQVNLQQVATLVPSLNYSSANPRNTATTIRGLGSSVVSVSQANDGLEPGVGIYVDEVYHARPATAALTLPTSTISRCCAAAGHGVWQEHHGGRDLHRHQKPPSWGAEAKPVTAAEFPPIERGHHGPLIADLAAFRLSGLTKRRGDLEPALQHGRTASTMPPARANPDHAHSQPVVRLIGDWASFRGECCTQVYVRVAPTQSPWPSNMPDCRHTPHPPPTPMRITDIDGPWAQHGEGGASMIGTLTSGPLPSPRSRRGVLGLGCGQ
jgi:iron complex outermembrane receptor protein